MLQQLLGKLKEAVIEDHGNTEYDSGSSKYDNYITKYGNNSKDNFSLHYVTFPGKGGPWGAVQGAAVPFKQKALGLPPLQNGYYGCTRMARKRLKTDDRWNGSKFP